MRATSSLRAVEGAANGAMAQFGAGSIGELHRNVA